MNTKLTALAGALVLSLGTLTFVNADDHSGPGKHRHRERGMHRHMMLDRLSGDLNLTADQKTRVQPIIDQARPQIRAIHDEARQKTKAVVDNTMTQIRPLLMPEQQQKLDAMKKAHEDMRAAREEMSAARAQ